MNPVVNQDGPHAGVTHLIVSTSIVSYSPARCDARLATGSLHHKHFGLILLLLLLLPSSFSSSLSFPLLKNTAGEVYDRAVLQARAFNLPKRDAAIACKVL